MKCSECSSGHVLSMWMYFMTTSCSCCSETASQHDAATPVLDVWVDVLRFTSLPLFPSTFDGCHYSQTVATFVFFFSTRHVLWNSGLCLGDCLWTVIWLFMFLSEKLFLPRWEAFQPTSVQDYFYCGWWYFLTSFSQHLCKFWRLCCGIWFAHLIPQMFLYGTQSWSPPWVVWWLDISNVLMFVCNLKRTWNRQSRWLRLLELQNDQTHGSRAYEVWPWNTRLAEPSTHT